MTELKQFKLPDVGEGLTEADIVKWHVQPGDQVTVNQTIVEIETAKALVELPCPFEGVVAGLLVGEGETVDVGTPIISVDVSGDTGQPDGVATDTERLPRDAPTAPDSVDLGQPAPGAPRGSAATPPSAVSRPASATREDGGPPLISATDLAPSPSAGGAVEPGVHGGPAPRQARQPVLVGYGIKLGSTARRPRKPTAATSGPAASSAPAASPVSTASPAPAALPAPAASPALAASPASTASPASEGPSAPTPAVSSAAPTISGSWSPISPSVPLASGVSAATRAALPGRLAVLAKPPVRKLARELGVDLTTVTGTGPSGSISRADVHGAADVAAGQAIATGRALTQLAHRWHRHRCLAAGGADRRPRRAQAHGCGGGSERVHRSARHRVPASRRDRDHGGGAADPRPARVRTRAGVPAAVRGEGTAARRRSQSNDQFDLGRRGAGDRGQALREPWHRGGHRSRAHRPQHQGRARAGTARARPRDRRARRDRAGRPGPRPPTCRAAPSRSPMSGYSG